ncbi:MAG: signal peptidase II, partial [Alphaproteobacteria bacterium]
VIAADQLSKWWILAVVMNPPELYSLTSFFNIVLVWNRGASFGMFGSAPGWVSWALAAFAVMIAIALLIWMRLAKSRLLTAALGLVAGGALGNVVDRVRFGAVVDFLDFHVGAWHWPAFNVADAAITIGVMLLILDSFKSDREKP